MAGSTPGPTGDSVSTPTARRFRPGGRPESAAGGVLLSIVSQGLSSLTNLGLTVSLVLLTEPAELGRWVASISVYLLALTVLRSVVLEPMVTEARSASTPAGLPVWEKTRRDRWRLAGAASVGAGVVAIAVGLHIGAAVLLAVAMAPLLAQDGHRYRAWADGRPSRAVSLDVVWIAVSVLVAVTMEVAVGLRPGLVVGAWVAGGVAGAAVGRWSLRSTPGPADPARTDVRSTEAADPEWAAALGRLAWSQGAFACAFNALPVVVAVGVSAPAAAAVRTLLLPYAPILSLMAGVRVVTLPIMARAAIAGTGDRVVRRILLAAVGPVAVAAAVTAVASTEVTARLSGPSVAEIRPHLPWGAVLCVLYVATQMSADGLAIGRRSSRVLGVRAATIASEWAGLLIGAAVGGVAGLAVGWTIGLAVGLALWLTAFLIGPADRRRPSRARGQ